MIEKIITGYHKFKMGIINEFSGVSDELTSENNFYDVGFIQSQISNIQKELQRITNELQASIEINKNTSYEKERRNKLLLERERLLYHMIFYASNGFSNLDDCLNIADGYDFPFVQCIIALKYYGKGDQQKCFEMLEKYFCTYGSVEEHFLVNKVFGILLAERKKYHKAIPFLIYALQFVPDDLECLNALRVCYKSNGDVDKENMIEEIISILD